MIRNHAIFEIDVEYTQTLRHTDKFDEFSHFSKHPQTKKTFRVIADKYSTIAEAWVSDQFKHEKDHNLKILEIRKLDIDALIETHTW